MSEKRFTFGPVSPNFAMIKNNGEPMDTEEVVDKLNEQQATINKLKEENEQLRRELERVCLQNSLVSDELNVLKRLTLVDTARRFLNE